MGKEQECDLDQHFCVSYTGYLKKGQAQVLFRACTETNMSHFCGVHLEQLTNNRVERLIACYRTCSTDLCNVHRMEYLSTAPSTLTTLPPFILVSLTALGGTMVLRLFLGT
ncbi:hypothetical protein Pmani_007759 [Petrolisthes manimaculis]|uniref:Uncharacterized protein n=1 Tax=Petrolisthes manimaculis TaxID=1843537 RepID=A0AAE1Q6Z9_9EUCA|nr:hypothetical protein Pmani_007759 [Petrolisthes manimaculis]